MKVRRKRLRLYTIGVVFALITFTLWARLIQIQIFSHGHYIREARKQWTKTIKIPAVRGGIYDRNGMPLALSSSSYSIFINPNQIKKNKQRIVSKIAKITKIPASAIYKKMASKTSFVYLVRKINLTQDQAKELGSLPGVGTEVEADRTYPFGKVANKIVGFCGYDDKGMAGIEAAFDDVLRGKPGWEKIILDGRNKAHVYDRLPKKKPINGHNIILTIDESIQEIAEVELEKAVRRSRSKWGSAIVMNCKTGEILALAEYPSATSRSRSSMADSLWTIRSISCVYEPGSTFKLITAASLLEEGLVSSTDVFFAENGKGKLEFATIRDAHPYGYLTFREAFVFSSNIVMAKASLKLKPREFYKFIRLFGFGAKTGIRLSGESAGYVSPVEKWSKRTQATIAFGQEIAVTPLQMINSYAAVANNGVLMVPFIVKDITDENGKVIKHTSPVRIRNVISKKTAYKLRSFCRDVVEQGTGKTADIKLLRLCGKTGTGQKASKRGGYQPGKFVASFIGFLPYEDPKIACLVLLDEPAYSYRFGGVSAAPVFAEISRSIANSTDIFNSELVEKVVKRKEKRKRMLPSPNFIRMNVFDAMAEAKRKGLNALCNSTDGQVISQDPDPGVLIRDDEVIRLFVDERHKVSRVPDLRGMPLREAKKVLIGSGFKPKIRGSGIVDSQIPKPGRKATSKFVTLRCKEPATGRNSGR